MTARLRTYRLLPVLLSAALLLGVSAPLVQHACSASGQMEMASPPGASVLGAAESGANEHACEAHALPAAMGKPCDEMAPGGCAHSSSECSEVQTRSLSEAPAPSQRGDYAQAQLLLPLAASLASFTSTAETGPRAPRAPEDDVSPLVPARLLFAVLLL